MKTLEETRRERAKNRQVQSSRKHVMMKRSGIVSGVVAFGLLVLAVLALDVEISFLHVEGEQKRARVLPGTGVVCLFGSSVGTLVARSPAVVTGHEILRAKTPAALALALTEEQELQPTEGEQSS
jgi:hypothetical protein